MEARSYRAMTDMLSRVAPGTPLRDGLNRVLQSGRGGLIVIGDSDDVLNICSGGFLLDAAFTPQRLSELAKMDGAIILAGDGSRIARANVHLVPNPNVPTSETGTRHRTAERVARSLNVTVVSVSESRKEIQVYMGDQKRTLNSVTRLLERSNQALSTLERYRTRLERVSRNLSALEVEDLVTLRDVIEVLQRTEMVVRIAAEIENNLVELGTDGRLARLQLDELMAGVADERRLVIRDYFNDEAGFDLDEAMEALAELTDEALFDEEVLAKTLHLAESSSDLDQGLEPRGYRLLTRVPRLGEAMVDGIVEELGPLSGILRAPPATLARVIEGDERRAVTIKANIARVAETSILERYQS